jgi:hypothetical protein
LFMDFSEINYFGLEIKFKHVPTKFLGGS